MIDLDVDVVFEVVSWFKLLLELVIEIVVGCSVWMIGVYVKFKVLYGVKNDKDVMWIVIENCCK